MNNIKLETPKDYVNLYEKMGCVDFMSHFFHMYDDMGAMIRILHWSKAYALSIGYDKETHFCGQCEKFHAKMVVDDPSIKEFVTRCPLPESDPNDYRSHPRYYAGPKASKGYGFVQPNVNGNYIWDDIFKARMFYNSVYIWDPIVLDYQDPINREKFRQANKIDYIRGYLPTLEIDVKGIQNNRKDMLNVDIFQDIDIVDGYIKDKFKSEFDNGFTKRTSGNGMYYQVDPITINDKTELDEIMLGFYDYCMEIEDYFIVGSELKLKNIIFDTDTIPGWNKYFKCPFSLHRKFNRISLPLPVNKNLDYDYIKTYSDPENINPDVVIEIVKEAGYKYNGN